MQEVWLPVVGWEGLYEVSDQGRVRSLQRFRNGRTYGGKLLTAVLNPYYLVVRLRDAATSRSASLAIHTLVAAAFIGPRLAGQVVRHGANGPLDNSLANISYGTQAENTQDRWRDGTYGIADNATHRILTSTQVAEIWLSGEPSPALALRYEVHETTIRKIWAGKNWGSVTSSLPARVA
jgi:hypothetical protein